MALLHFQNPVVYGEPATVLEFDLYCIKTIGVGDCRDGQYQFVFKKGEKYKGKSKTTGLDYNMLSYSVLPTENNHGGETFHYGFGKTNSETAGFVWEYFETKQERRIRVIKNILEENECKE